MIWALSRPAPELIDSNGISPSMFVATLEPRAEVCSGLGVRSERASGLRFTVGTFGAPSVPLRLTIDGAAREIPASSYAQGAVVVPLPEDAPQGGRTACVTNLGKTDVVVAGDRVEEQIPTVRGGKRARAAIAFDLIDDDPPSWSARVGAIVGLVGSTPGSLVSGAGGYLVCALAIAGLVLAIGSVARWAR